MELEEKRKKIDELDKQVVALMEARMVLVEEIAVIKNQEKTPVLDLERENIVLDKVASYVKEEKYRPALTALYQAVMATSREFQEREITKNSCK